MGDFESCFRRAAGPPRFRRRCCTAVAAVCATHHPFVHLQNVAKSAAAERCRVPTALAVSGFTNLGTKLDIDVLQAHINEYFTRLVGVVTGFGGDVIRFAGDAM
eukprot:4763352-Prymnesium_polylepis.2